jgi:hypothetical protein
VVLEGVFRPVTATGDGFVAQRRNCLAAGAALTPDRLSGMREIIWRQLRLLPAADGAGFVAAPGVITGKDRHLEWWQRTASGDGGPDEFARIRLNLDPESIDLYDYLDMDWFTIPQREGRPHVYGPYIDFSGADRYVVTMTVPVTGARAAGEPEPGGPATGVPPTGVPATVGREFLGVAGADIRMSPPGAGTARDHPLRPRTRRAGDRRAPSGRREHAALDLRHPTGPAARGGGWRLRRDHGDRRAQRLATRRRERPRVKARAPLAVIRQSAGVLKDVGYKRPPQGHEVSRIIVLRPGEYEHARGRQTSLISRL